jgi:phosphoribosylamine--glycine ligase / phosphoribosylformylglycinamidine cyclo-ligase
MRILVVGSGGREHALAWKLARSPHVSQLFVVPGNGGTASIAQNVPIAVTDIPALVSFAHQEQIDLTVVGPEAALVIGLVDAFNAAGLRAFGPTAAAARLEGSKAFAKQFMIEEGIPTAPAAMFRDYEAARAYLCQTQPPVVVKADGLAAGKGVLICQTTAEAEAALHQVMVERAFGSAGDECLIEACLQGEEVSLLAFCDGRTVAPMLPARDYKRVGDGDQGPNTGGMGGFAPSPYLPPALVKEIVARVLQPTVDGMRRRGAPYAGVLYAGLMLTDLGPRVLEFNCRFGDPETQSLMPLLESDLVEICLACIEGRLDQIQVRWSSDYAACIVLASGGYPGSYESGKEIEINGDGDREGGERTVVFHAGTKQQDGRLVTAGGRVLAFTSTAPTLSQARAQAYAAAERTRFEGMHYRKDIAQSQISNPLKREIQQSAIQNPQSTYAAAGVDIEAKMGAFQQMRTAIEGTYTPAVLAGVGAFGGLFDLKKALGARDLILVASTDGVGTKTMIATATGCYNTVGHDIVNHCVNDILVQGARPLFFLDYVAASKLDPERIAAIVRGCAKACQVVGCVLLGGETAEMPGVYQADAFDLVGTMVGWVERDAIVDGRTVRPGDVCLGLPSSGLHTNGYSLARRIFADTPLDTVLPELGRPLGEVLLTPHRPYLKELESLWAAGVQVKAMAHITGGGFTDNIPRVLPAGIGVRIDRTAWRTPAIFDLIQEWGRVDEMEMYRVFNMGIGMVLLVASEQVEQALGALKGAMVIGQAVAWDETSPQVHL